MHSTLTHLIYLYQGSLLCPAADLDDFTLVNWDMNLKDFSFMKTINKKCWPKILSFGSALIVATTKALWLNLIE